MFTLFWESQYVSGWYCWRCKNVFEAMNNKTPGVK